jgi:beta-lactamase regulating signal transducer with metallopeptidase domain
MTPVPVPAAAPGAGPIYVPSAPDILITVFLGIWAAIALVSLLRVLPALRAVYALRDRCEPFPASVESRLPLWLEARARGRGTQLRICDAAPGATALGFGRPCIAIPSSHVTELTIDELDQVILHEHAHLQRRDDWSRLAQTLLLSVLWIHPAAVIASRALSREREMACDEWVVARTGLPKAYARCLAHAAELRMHRRGAPPLVPALIGRRHELVRRVDRILAMRRNARAHVSLAAAAVAAFVMVTASVHLQSLRFAELAEIILPHVSSPLLTMPDEVKGVAQLPVTVRLKPDPAYEQATAADASHAPGARKARSAPGARNAPGAPSAPNAPSLSARIFTGAYDAPLAPLALLAPLAPNAPNQWVQIGTTAKKTSLGIAGVFTRAGASLARSF